MAIEYDLKNCVTLGGAGADPGCPYSSPPPGEYECALSFAGVTIPNFPSMSFDAMEPLMAMLRGLMGMMAPLMPFFDLLELVMQIVKCVEAVPKSILSLNPGGLIQCIVDLIQIAAKVVGHIPPLSLPKTIAGIICTILSLLVAVLQFLKYLACKLEDLKLAFELNLDLFDVEFSAMISCEESNVMESFGIIRKILKIVLLPIEVVNTLLELAQLEPIPIPSFDAPEGPSGSVGPDGSFLGPIISILDKVAQGLHLSLQVIPGGSAMIVA